MVHGDLCDALQKTESVSLSLHPLRKRRVHFVRSILSIIPRMIPIIDLHEDIAGASSDEALKRQTDFAQLEEANVKIVLGTGFVLPGENFESVIDRDFSFYEKRCADVPLWRIIKSRNDVESMGDGHGIIFHIEGFHGFSGNESLLSAWYERGWRSTGLVWNEDNLYGGGTHSRNGLTERGRACIAWCEKRNILIDFSHMNPVMFADCVSAVRNPPFISHGGLDALAPSPRNFTDDQVRTIAERGGVCGVFFPRSAMAKGAVYTSDDVVDHIMHVIAIAGEDCPALGSDFGGMTSGTPSDLSSVSHLSALWQALSKRGCSAERIEKIAFKNAARYLREHMRAM